jgi:D-cysteine desulfhydrase
MVLATAGLMLGPTPLQPADRLGRAIGLHPGQLWIKRDDLTPLAGGGNKVRKLDHLCAAALAAGADTLVTGGGPQSNHIRLTAAAARHLGLDAVAVLAGDPPAEASGNLVVDALLGPALVWTGRASMAEVEEAIGAVAADLRNAGRRPYVIPIGGADALGSQGYVSAAAELRAQLREAIPAETGLAGTGLAGTGLAGTGPLVVTPAGSGGTQAGLAVGLGRHDLVLGVDVGAFDDVGDRIGELSRQTAALAGLPEPTGAVRVDRRYAGAGYGTELAEVRAALLVAARTEGLVLDPVYTGKALAALAGGISEGSVSPSGPVVFLHSGGAFGLLSSRYSAWAAGPLA